MADCPLVLVEWLDSARPVAAWQHLSDFEPGSVIECSSVGWLIHDGDDLKAIAANLGHTSDEENVQACGVIRIPTCCVTRIVTLNEGENADG